MKIYENGDRPVGVGTIQDINQSDVRWTTLAVSAKQFSSRITPTGKRRIVL